MILSDDQLRRALTGAVEITTRNGHLAPLRFGKKVREIAYPEGNRFREAMFHTSGVTAHFVTNSHTLAFFYAVPEAGAGHSFDVTVNGVLFSHTPCTARSGRVEVALPAPSSDVTIYFPHHAAGQIFDLSLDDGAAFDLPPAPAFRWLLLGDSITHGSSASFASMTYGHQTARALGAEIINQGISGEYFNPFAVDDELPFKPDLITSACGTNDWSQTTRGRLIAAVNGTYARLRDKYPEAPIVQILPFFRMDYTRITGVGSFEDARTIIREAAARYGVNLIDGVELIPHLPAFFADARLHPNDLGFQFIADGLIERLPAFLKNGK